MLLGDFLFALQGKFLAKSESLLARPGVREASVRVCEQMGAPGAPVCLSALDEASSHRSGCWWKQGKYNQRKPVSGAGCADIRGTG